MWAWLAACEPDPAPVVVEMPEVCALGAPTSLDAGLPTGSWTGWRLIEGDDHLVEISMTTEPDTVWTEGVGGGFAWLALETFDFGVDPVVWYSLQDPRGTCEVGPGTLDCVIDDPEAGHTGTRTYRFSAACQWIDETLFVDDITQVSHTEVALLP